jgi:hypothetical protein
VKVGVLGLLAASAQSARADETTTASLSWVRLPGAESCISSQELSRRVEARLGRPLLVTPSNAGLPIEARIEPTERGFLATIETMGADGQRRGSRVLVHEGSDCRALDGKLELVIALTIDPDAELKEPGSALPVRPVKPAARPRERSCPACPAVRCPSCPPKEAREPWRAAIMASGVIGFGLLPGTAFGARISVALTPPGLIPIDAGGTAWVDRSETTDAGGAEASRFTGHLRICPEAPLANRLLVSVCAGFEAGIVRGRGFDFDRDQSQNVAAVSLIAGPELRWTISGGWFVLSSAMLHVPILRPRLFYRAADGSEQEIYRAGAVGVSAGLGAGFAF